MDNNYSNHSVKYLILNNCTRAINVNKINLWVYNVSIEVAVFFVIYCSLVGSSNIYDLDGNGHKSCYYSATTYTYIASCIEYG